MSCYEIAIAPESPAITADIGPSLALGSLITTACGVFIHEGNNDPTTEGWIANIGNVHVGPEATDQGFDAWFIDDDSRAIGSIGFYFQYPTANEVSQGNTYGWTLRTFLRIVDGSDAAFGGIVANYVDGLKGWVLMLRAEADNDPVVALDIGNPDFPEITLEGLGGGYHLYELVYDPVAGSADLVVDGIVQIHDFPGRTLAPEDLLPVRIEWGALSSGAMGHTNYNLAEWRTAVPINYAWHKDEDGDTFGSNLDALLSCEQPFGYVLDDTDCDDTDPSVYPRAIDIPCNGIDEDCSGSDDESTALTWYRDFDGDGFGNFTDSIIACSPPLGYVEFYKDCDDNDPSVYPGAIEVCGNNIDNNCDGQIDENCFTSHFSDQLHQLELSK